MYISQPEEQTTKTSGVSGVGDTDIPHHVVFLEDVEVPVVL